MAALMDLDAQSARVNDPAAAEIYTAFRHIWGDPASGSSVAGSYLTRDKSNLV